MEGVLRGRKRGRPFHGSLRIIFLTFCKYGVPVFLKGTHIGGNIRWHAEMAVSDAPVSS